MNKAILSLSLCCCVVFTLQAQQSQRQFTNNFNSWWMYFGDHKISSKWGVHLEAQLRRSDGVSIGQQLLLRPGINYHFNQAASAMLGYCFAETYPYGEFAVKSTFPEHRLWEQLQLKQQIGPLEAVSRFRLEQRWVLLPTLQGDGYKPGPAVYSNRFRYLARFSVPFKGSSIVDRSWYLTAYDELWVSFGKNVAYNVFDQNRAYIALGYRIPKAGRVELGYMFQRVFKGDGIKVENNHTLMVSLISNIAFYY